MSSSSRKKAKFLNWMCLLGAASHRIAYIDFLIGKLMKKKIKEFEFYVNAWEQVLVFIIWLFKRVQYCFILGILVEKGPPITR